MKEAVQHTTTLPETAKPAMDEAVKEKDMSEEKAKLTVQPKLSVGAPDDPYEKEADSMADKVMRMPGENFVQRKCAGCEKEEEVQRKPLAASVTPFIQTKTEAATTSVSDTLSRSIQSSRGGGSSMDRNTQSFMSQRFGTGFNDVKIHTGGDAIQMSAELNAKAFTVGNDVYFNKGQYQPGSDSGKHLLAHELTHVVQQGKSDQSIQRDCLTTAPTSSDQIVTFEVDGAMRRAEFTDSAGAETFISRQSDSASLRCFEITREARTIYAVYRRTTGGTVASGGGAGSGTTALPDAVFTTEEAHRMRNFFITNASGHGLACINTVRAGIGSLLYDNPDVMGATCPGTLTMTANNTMEETMAQLQTTGIAGSVHEVHFFGETTTAGTGGSRVTTRVRIARGSGLTPVAIDGSLWDTITGMIGSDAGFSVFGLSICDGYHSAIITVDHSVSGRMRLFWSDQTHRHRVLRRDRIRGVSGTQYGWERMSQSGSLTSTPRGLDAYILHAIRAYWGIDTDVPDGRCYPVVRVWRITRPGP